MPGTKGQILYDKRYLEEANAKSEQSTTEVLPKAVGRKQWELLVNECRVSEIKMF